VFGGVWYWCDDAQGAVSEGEARSAALRQGPPLCPPEEETTVECALPRLVSAGPMGLLLLEQGVASCHVICDDDTSITLCFCRILLCDFSTTVQSNTLDTSIQWF